MPAGRQRRSKRDPESSRRLDEVQKLMKARREAATRRESEMMDAVQIYLRAAGSIRQCTAIRDQRVSELRKRIERLEGEHEAEVTRWRAQQAGAVSTMRDLGESDDDISELLELTNRQVRQLIAVALVSVAAQNDPDSQGRTRPDHQEPERPGMQRESRAGLNAEEPAGQSLA